MPTLDRDWTIDPATAECGTYAGYQRHGRKGTQACKPCKKANADYQRNRYQDPDVRRKRLDENTARRRAYQRLAREYPARFTEFYQEELRTLGGAS